MTEMVTSGSMSGEGRRSNGLLGERDYERRRSLQAPPALFATAPFFNSTQPDKGASGERGQEKMDQNSASWNRVVLWMRQLESLSRVS
jgi:hypothetical protein